MDDYEEYRRMAKMMTKIHAKPQIQAPEGDENQDEGDYNENRDIDEDIREEHKYAKFKISNGLDVSMEEEKEPLQNLNCNFNQGK